MCERPFDPGLESRASEYVLLFRLNPIGLKGVLMGFFFGGGLVFFGCISASAEITEPEIKHESEL